MEWFLSPITVADVKNHVDEATEEKRQCAHAVNRCRADAVF